MKTSNYLILSTSPLSQPAVKPRRTASLTHPQRPLYGRKRRHPTGKERDSETGLYYYGARYLDGRTGRWISGDPAVGEYVPEAPVNGEARKRNQSLPGMGGVFNYANLHTYHYSFNNPINYIDPDGRNGNSVLNRLKNLVNSVDQFIFENKEALLTITLGGVQVIAGNMLKGTSIGGGLLIAGASGGSLAPIGVAVAVAGVSVSEVLEVTGTITVIAGLAMLSVSNDKSWHRNTQNSQKSHQAQEKEDVDRILGEIKKETGKISSEQREAIREAIHDAKNGSRDTLPIDELRMVMRNAIGLD